MLAAETRVKTEPLKGQTGTYVLMHEGAFSTLQFPLTLIKQNVRYKKAELKSASVAFNVSRAAHNFTSRCVPAAKC